MLMVEDSHFHPDAHWRFFEQQILKVDPTILTEDGLRYQVSLDHLKESLPEFFEGSKS